MSWRWLRNGASLCTSLVERMSMILEANFQVGSESYRLEHVTENDSRNVVRYSDNKLMYRIDSSLEVTDSSGGVLGVGVLEKTGWTFIDAGTLERVVTGSQSTVKAEVEFAKHLLSKTL